jgi:hypothetical protein
MIILSGVANSLQAKMSGAAATNQPTFFVDYVEVAASVPTLLAANASGSLNGTTLVSLLVGSASYQTKISQIEIYNTDTAPVTVTVSVLVTATSFNLYTATIPVSGALHYTESTGFYTTDANGFPIVTTPTITLSGQITGTTAATVLSATTNSTLTTLSALSLPGSQVTGNIAGNAANITATSNSTLTSLPSLVLPASQLSGTTSAAQEPAHTGDVTNTAGSLVLSLVATTNGTLVTLSALSLPVGQLTGVLPVVNGGTGQSTNLAAFQNDYASQTACWVSIGGI